MGEVGACLATEMTSYVSDIAEHVLGIRERRGEPRLTNCVGIHSTLLSIFSSIINNGTMGIVFSLAESKSN